MYEVSEKYLLSYVMTVIWCVKSVAWCAVKELAALGRVDLYSCELFCADDLSGIFVRGIAEGCAAALDGRIRIHDQIIAVCNNTYIPSSCVHMLQFITS